MKICAWFMTHRPTPDQRADLEARGYDVIHISQSVKDYSSERIWQYIQDCCPDVALVVAVMPARKLAKLAYVAPVPILTARMQREDKGNGNAVYHWSGRWQQVVGWAIKTEHWTGTSHLQS